jgi:hypothetical protein
MKIIYPIKHWLTTLLISPIFLVFYDSVVDTNFVFNEPTIYMLFLTMGAVLSLPGLAGYIYIFKQLQKNGLTDLQMRLILIPIAGLMAVIAFWLIKGSLMIPMMLSYVTGVIISGCLFSTKEPIPD